MMRFFLSSMLLSNSVEIFFPMCSHTGARSEQDTTVPWLSVIIMLLPVDLAMALMDMLRSQLLRESALLIAAAVRETSLALLTMESWYSRMKYTRPIPTLEKATSKKQVRTSTAVAVKFLK